MQLGCPRSIHQPSTQLAVWTHCGLCRAPTPGRPSVLQSCQTFHRPPAFSLPPVRRLPSSSPCCRPHHHPLGLLFHHCSRRLDMRCTDRLFEAACCTMGPEGRCAGSQPGCLLPNLSTTQAHRRITEVQTKASPMVRQWQTAVEGQKLRPETDWCCAGDCSAACSAGEEQQRERMYLGPVQGGWYTSVG